MDPFNAAPDFILDLIFLKLSEEDLHETLRVSKSWFWASIRRIKKLEITSQDNPLKSIAEFYNNHRQKNQEMDWRDLFKHLVLDDLVIIDDMETTNYLVSNGCNTAKPTIEASQEECPVSLVSLKMVTRLQAFEYRSYWDIDWHSFIVECLESSNCGFHPNIECPINAIKLNPSGWNSEDPVLQSVTKLGFYKITIDFLRELIDLCPNLEEIHCSGGYITQNWHQVFPANVKIVELHKIDLDDDVATMVNASKDAGRQLLPYLCQNWKSVEKFEFVNYFYWLNRIFYQGFPQQREKVLGCASVTEGMNIASLLFESLKICLEYDGREALELTIPPTKSVEFELSGGRDFKFSPRAVCSEPGKVEHLALSLPYYEGISSEPFEPSDFEGFCRLTSLTLGGVNAATVKMALDQCSSIKKLKTFTIGNMSSESSYANVVKLVLAECEEPMENVFTVLRQSKL